MNPELERAQDMLSAMQMQRDNALNAMVHAQAALAAKDREIAALRQQLEETQHAGKTSKPELVGAA